MDERIIELISRRRRQVLVHSSLYYRFNTNLIDDHTYDKWTKELAELQAKYPDEAKQAVYAEEFEDFDGSTGFDLPHHYPEVFTVAMRLLNYKHDEGAN